MTKKSPNLDDLDNTKLIFVNKDKNGSGVHEIDAPTTIAKRRKALDTVGGNSKFVSLEYIASVVGEDGEPIEKAKRLLGIFTVVRMNAMSIPEHIDILEYLESEMIRDKVRDVLQVGGGKIKNLAELIKQAMIYNVQGTPHSERHYGENEPYFDSFSIDNARGSDRPVTEDAAKILLEHIKRKLEEYAAELE